MEEEASTVSTEVSPAPAPPLATEGREGLFDPLNFNFKTFEKIDFQPEYYENVIKSFEGKELINIEVMDNGGGIPSHIMPKIFEPYFTTKHQSKGTGLGLYMSHEIITKHMNGSFEVLNNELEIDNFMYTWAHFKITLHK